MLTKTQQEFLPAMRWIFSPARANGKTYLMCYGALEAARNFCGMSVNLIDHYSMSYENIRHNVIRTAFVVAENEFPDDKFEFMTRESSVRWIGKKENKFSPIFMPKGTLKEVKIKRKK